MRIDKSRNILKIQRSYVSVKKIAIFLFLLPLSIYVHGQSKLKSGAKKPIGFAAIQQNFVHIPDSIQTSVYWYWISGNISKDGVVKDLEAMKKVGINRAFIGNIGLDDVPYSKIKMFSEEWWGILHTALKTATRLNIQIGIFNGPGWSQSGGPWVKPQQSMRFLTSSQTMVNGPLGINKKLEKPGPDFQDVKILAYPVIDGFGGDINTLKPTLNATPAIDSLDNLIDHNLKTIISLSKNTKYSVDITTKMDYTVRSITITTSQSPARLVGEVQAKVDDKYVTLTHFNIDRTNPRLYTGFMPYGPAAISIPATTSTGFRILITATSGNSGIAELKLSATPMVEDYIEKTLAKMWPTPLPLWDAYQWRSQSADSSTYTIDPAKVIDVSRFMKTDGTLIWNVPAGNWVIERTGMMPTTVTNAPSPPEGLGLEIDKMSREHVTSHFNAFLGEIIKRIPAADRKSWKVVVADSYETGGQNWTDSLEVEFKRKYNYDPTPYMPVLKGQVVGSADRSNRFLWDLRRLIADDLSFKYVGGLRDISHKNGLTTWLENYGHWGFPGEFLQYGGQSDEIGGEFWSEGDLGNIENRAASSSAHIYGKTKVSAESFTAGHRPFNLYPAMFKQRGDRFFTEGINNTLLHVYISQPKDISPGLTAWFGVEFNRLNTWFFDMDVFLRYIKRCNMMLQQGQYVADVAYFIGEDVPKMTGITDPALPNGYSFDYINADVIRQRLTVKNGKLVLPNGISYSILVLPKLQTMRPELLAKIKELVQQGAVILGPRPESSPSLANYPLADQQVKSMASQLWGNIDGKKITVNSYGQGLVLSGMDMQQALDFIKVAPDLRITKSDSILFIHRQLKDGSVYFISNQKSKVVNFSGAFRITGKSPELWDAVSGSLRDLPVYHQSKGITSVPLQLAPLESAFVIFRKNGTKGNAAKANYPNAEKTIKITTPWIVNFDKASRGPANPVVFETLTDWSTNTNDSIRYYSGSAYYHNTFKIAALQKSMHYRIDLGAVAAIAKVRVNGIDIGGAWTPPYQLDITKVLRSGENKLEIKVVNTWVNRLIGDSKLPPEQRKAIAQHGPDPKGSLQPSGLLGQVKIEMIKY
jgi:hypothetical protein